MKATYVTGPSSPVQLHFALHPRIQFYRVVFHPMPQGVLPSCASEKLPYRLQNHLGNLLKLLMTTEKTTKTLNLLLTVVKVGVDVGNVTFLRPLSASHDLSLRNVSLTFLLSIEESFE